MKVTRTKTVALGLVSATLALTGCSSSDEGGDSGSGDGESGDYKLLGIIATSGPYQSYGKLTKNAITVQAKAINADGGINGRKIVLEWVDDQGDATKAVSLLQEKLASGARPDAVLAGSSSNETLALLPILTREKIINIGSTGADPINDPEKFPYTFRATSPFASAAHAAALQFKEKGFQKIGILQGDDALGTSNSASYKKAMEDEGLDTVEVSFSPTSLDLSAPMSKIKSADVDAVVFSAVAGTTAAQVLQARVKTGVTDVPIFADTATTADLADLVPAEALKNAFATSYNVALAEPQGGVQEGVAAFISEMKKLGPIDSTLITPALNADGLKLLQVAAEQAKSTDVEKMSEALENLADQPEGTWLTWAEIKFSKDSHFNLASRPSDYSVTTLGRIVDGQVTVQK